MMWLYLIFVNQRKLLSISKWGLGLFFLSPIFGTCWNIGNSNISELGFGFVLIQCQGCRWKKGSGSQRIGVF